jgi:probable HAF family extracellular repeat protein
MKSRILRYTITMLTALSISLPLAAQDAQSANKGPTHYSVINLGTLGGSQGAAFGINNKGWVIGDANLQGDQNEHGFLWREGVKTDLGTFGGLNSTAPGPVNDKGVIAGGAQTPEKDPLGEQWVYFCTNNPCQGGDHITLPFRWQDGVKTALPTLGGNQGIAEGINNRGQIVGFAENSTHDPSCIAPQVLDFEAVIWGPEEGEIHELLPFPGDDIGVAATINDHGQVVGCSGTCGSAPSITDCVHATLWQNGSVTDLGSFGGAMNNLAAAINNRGQVAGGSDLPGDTTGHAFLWTEDSGLQDLGTLPGDFSSGSSGMNDKGQVVGQSCNSDFSVCRAFLWQNGVMTDLNTLIPANSPLFLIYGATINNRGEIVGEAVDQSGNAPAFLAIPCNGECEDGAEGPTDVSQRPQIILPENLREQLRQRRGFRAPSTEFTAGNAQPETVNFLGEDSGINFGQATGSDSCIPNGGYGCGPYGGHCCSGLICSEGRCCRNVGQYCNKGSDCCTGICSRAHRCIAW